MSTCVQPQAFEIFKSMQNICKDESLSSLGPLDFFSFLSSQYIVLMEILIHKYTTLLRLLKQEGNNRFFLYVLKQTTVILPTLVLSIFSLGKLAKDTTISLLDVVAMLVVVPFPKF